jgi:hypothetical protein
MDAFSGDAIAMRWQTIFLVVSKIQRQILRM